MADEPMASDADRYLADFHGKPGDIPRDGLLRSIARTRLTTRGIHGPSEEEVEEEIARMFEDARTRTALDRLKESPDR